MKINAIRELLERPFVVPAMREALAAAGFSSALEAADALERGALPRALHPYATALREASGAVRGRLRHVLARDDPSGLHADTPAAASVDPWTVDATEYVDPASMRSRLSPANYLREIYRTLDAGVVAKPGHALAERRPDLAGLQLSGENFAREVTTLSQAIAVMEAYLSAGDPVTPRDALYEQMATGSHPFALPFDLHHVTVREALAAMGSDLNAVAHATANSIYGLADPAFTLVPNVFDKLRLHAHHRTILMGDYQLPPSVPGVPPPGLADGARTGELIRGVVALANDGLIHYVKPELDGTQAAFIYGLSYFFLDAQGALLKRIDTASQGWMNVVPALPRTAVAQLHCQVYWASGDSADPYRILSQSLQQGGYSAVCFRNGKYVVGRDAADGGPSSFISGRRGYLLDDDQKGFALNRAGDSRTANVAAMAPVARTDGADGSCHLKSLPDGRYWKLGSEGCEFVEHDHPSTRFYHVPPDWGEKPMTEAARYFTRSLTVADYSQLSEVGHFLEYASITSAEMNELVRNYAVRGERSPAPVTASHVYACYINRGTAPAIHVKNKTVDGATKAILQRTDGMPLDSEDLIAMDRLVRLYQRTGIGFQSLDWLLKQASDLHGLPHSQLTDATLSVIARHLAWKERLGTSVDEYVALIGYLNEHSREDRRQPSFLRQLFGDAAGWIATETAPEGARLLKDLSTAQADALRQGLKLTTLEWQIITTLAAGEKGPPLFPPERRFDRACLSALYRFARVLPLLGWGVAPGVALLRTVAPQLLGDLAGVPAPGLPVALDRLVWLRDALKASGLDHWQVLAILHHAGEDVLHAGQDTVDKLNALFTNLRPALLTSAHFIDHAEVRGGQDTTARIDWLKELQTFPVPAPSALPAVVDARGLVRNYDQARIEAVVDGVLAKHAVSPAPAARAGVVAVVLRAREQSCGALEAALSQDRSASARGILPLLRWMARTDPKIDHHHALSTLLAANFQLVDGGMAGVIDVAGLNAQTPTLEFLHRFGHYAGAVGALKLGPLEIAMLADHPQWLLKDAIGALDFRVLYFLARFKRLQRPPVDAAHWQAYLQQVNDPSATRPQSDLMHILARLLACDVNELDALCKDLLADKLPVDIAGVDLLARHLDQAKALAVSQAELKRIKQLNVGDAAPANEALPWEALAAAAQAAMIGVANHRQRDMQGPTGRRLQVAADTVPPEPVLDFLKASNCDAQDLFARAVALSADGLTAAIGAPGEASSADGVGQGEADNSAASAGAVYVFAREAAGWRQQAYIKASNSDAGDQFGASVSLSADGATLVVGAPYEDSSSRGVDGNQGNDTLVPDGGAAYVFTRDAGTWTQRAYVKPSDTDWNDNFGSTVALAGDGLTLAVASRRAVYVFLHDGRWREAARLVAANGEAGDLFGYRALAVSADGHTVAVGASQEAGLGTGIDPPNTGNDGQNVGAAYLFARAGTAWSQQAYIKASDAASFDFFGWAVALSADGDWLAVGTQRRHAPTDPPPHDHGGVYMFSRVAGAWSEQAMLRVPEGGGEGDFGGALALNGDGSVLAVGAWTEDGGTLPDTGAVHVFRRMGDAWSKHAHLRASNADTGDMFGRALAIAHQGHTLAVGAPGEASAASAADGAPGLDNSRPSAGAFYLYGGI